jgi:hypothetical protein
MPWDALPEHLNSPEKWKGTDNDVWYMRWEILTKGWMAFGPRSKKWWAAWQFPPKEVFKIGGAGKWRYEVVACSTCTPIGWHPWTALSRCQYYKRWALTVMWPLQITFHVYWKASDVPEFGQPFDNNFSIKKLLFMYGPIHWDADLIYWLLSFYLGGQWK